MKKCSTCHIEKDESEFDKAKNRLDGLQVYCKSCRRERSKNYYLKNKKKIIKKSVARNKTVANHRSVKWKEFKSDFKCHFCDETYHKCIDFHHVDPSTKKFTIAEQVHRVEWKILMEEVDKCISLCKNCHVKVHDGILKL